MTSTLPPNTPAGAIDLGHYGLINPGLHLYPSLYIPDYTLFPTAPFDVVYFKFTVDRSNSVAWLIPYDETPGASSFFTFTDVNGNPITDPEGDGSNRDPAPVGPLIAFNDGAPDSSTPHTYYVRAERTPGHETATFSFGLFAVAPYLDNDESGDTKGEALALTNLSASASISASDRLNTIYDRFEPDGPGLLEVDPGAPPLRADQIDFYTFNVTTAGTYRFTSSGSNVSYVLHTPATALSPGSAIRVANGNVVALSTGRYFIQVFDTATQVLAGGNGVTTFRQPWEVFDDYSFNLSYVGGGIPDFTAAMVSISNTSVAAGNNVNVTARIGNLGAPAATTYGYYLSTDPTVSKTDRLLLTGSLLNALPTDGIINLSSSVPVPAGLAPGTYYLGVVADYANTRGELNEANNASSTIRITVTAYNVGSAGNDSLTGTASSESMRGLGGNDRISALGGNDLLIGGTGNDTMLGGTGNDTYEVDAAGDVVTELPGQGTDLVRSTVTHKLSTYAENLSLLGATNINGTGNSLANLIVGNAGANRLDGGTGNDTLNGGAGNDTMVGGGGHDAYTVDAKDVIIEAAGSGIDTVQSTVTYTLAVNVENLRLVGPALIHGFGNNLNNIMVGNSATNLLSGLAGNDNLNGAAGRDRLVGGIGADVMTGGDGPDVFGFDALNELGKGATRDKILDFAVGLDDLDFSKIDANGSAAGNTAFLLLANNGDSFNGVAGELRWYWIGVGTTSERTIVEGDVNGDAALDFQVELFGLKSLSMFDIIL